jgi:hypothetical protein
VIEQARLARRAVVRVGRLVHFTFPRKRVRCKAHLNPDDAFCKLLVGRKNVVELEWVDMG